VGERLGDKVIEFTDVSKGFGDKLLMDKVNFSIPGAIVGIIGPNGAGKSTLFKMITGQDKPDSGDVVIGPTVKIAYVDQSRDCLDGSKTVFDELAGGADILTIGKFEMPSRAYIGRFNFKGGDQQKLVGNLSGGERGRLHLAKTLMSGGNVLLSMNRPTTWTWKPCGPGRCPAGICRLRADHLPRPLVPRPDLHPHPGGRRRVPMDLLRRQLPGIRGRQAQASGRGRRQAQAYPLQADQPLIGWVTCQARKAPVSTGAFLPRR
jgi:ABC-type transport system involved in cytochrome c biogenesis ATPase subunit